MMWRYPHLAGGVVDWLWFVLALAILVAAVALILWVVLRPREPRARGPQPPARDQAMEILRERLARGEINAAEFEEAKRILGG
jgi:putative membrane protein